MSRPDRWVADFDSATAMLRGVASALHGRPTPTMGTRGPLFERAMRPLSRLVDRLPMAAREQIYIRGGANEAVHERELASIDAEAIARWTCAMYPRDRRHRAIAIGSSNGALAHLFAAMDVPWLPQTLLIPVRRRVSDVDDVRADLAWGARAAPALTRANPELALHQMIDPVQDRLMIHAMAYFRVKRRALGDAYERFLRERLAPGGTIVVVDCGLSWGTTRVAERHVFQHGALGGATEDEYRFGGPRVRRYLHDERATRLVWEPPPIDARTPEAEWGFDERLMDDVLAFAARHGFRVRRLRLAQPEDASPLVADLFARWNARRGIDARRLLVASFILIDPWWTIRTGSIPFWIVFNKEPSADALARFVGQRAPFDRIDMTLFSHGVRSIGLVPLERWAGLRATARRPGALFGVDPRAFPADFGNFVRYHRDMLRGLSSRWPVDAPMPLGDLESLLAEAGDRYAVRLDDVSPAPLARAAE